MCSHTQILAQAQGGMFRSVAFCDCQGGLFHVSWDVSTLHLCQSDFMKLKMVLDTMRTHSRQTQQVWIGTVGLSLSPIDFNEFYRLMDHSIQVLKSTHQRKCLDPRPFN